MLIRNTMLALAISTLFVVMMWNLRIAPPAAKQLPLNAITDLQAAGLLDENIATVRGGMIDRLPDVYSTNIEDRR